MHRHRTTLLVATAVFLAVACPTGVAHAATVPDETGFKYSEAKKALSSAGFTILVASRIGDRTPLENCVVVSQHLKGEAQTTKNKVVPKKVLVAVECYDGVASAKKPGNSAASPKPKKG